MKKLSLLLALVLLITTSMVFAEDLVTDEVAVEEVVAEEVVTDEEATEEEATEEVSEKKGKGQLKQEAKTAMKDVIAQRKLIAKYTYTVEELATFEASVESISSDADVAKVLSVGSVSVKKNLIKFDTPPYIKGGRTVVPVRAITEGLGAEVSFNPETFEVTIVKGDTTIILSIGSNVAIVNGETVELDTQSEITNSRTYVPIRFIAETFGLTVDWDAETETIDIEEVQEEVQE